MSKKIIAILAAAIIFCAIVVFAVSGILKGNSRLPEQDGQNEVISSSSSETENPELQEPSSESENEQDPVEFTRTLPETEQEKEDFAYSENTVAVVDQPDIPNSSIGNLPEGYEQDWVRFDTDLTASIENNGYAEKQNALLGESWLIQKENAFQELGLSPVLESDGTQKDFYGISPIYSDANGNEYILSGEDAVVLKNKLIPDLSQQFILRNHDGYERVYLFDNSDDEAAFLSAREQGKALLENPDYDNWKVILNGEYLSNVQPVIMNDGNLYLSMLDLAQAYTGEYSFLDDSAILHIACDGYTIQIPTDGSPESVKKSYEFGYDENDQHVCFRFDDSGQGSVMSSFLTTLRTPISEKCYMMPEDIEKATGWEVFIKGRTISVVSDSLDDTNHTLCIVSQTNYYDLNGNPVEVSNG